jgi:hypothetical protein
MSFVVSSAGGVPDGLEIVGASPTTAETSGRTVASVPDILNPPITVTPMSTSTKTAAKTLRTFLLIF